MMNATKKERGPFLLSVLFVSVGIILLLLLWLATLLFSWLFSSDPANVVGDVVLVSVLVLPVLIYAIISGSLKELRGPGGVGATFNSVITEPVSEKLTHGRVSIDDGELQILPPGETRTLLATRQDLDETQPIFMKVTFGKGDYTLKELQDYVEDFYRFRSFELVVFLNEDERLIAFMPAWAVKQTLNDPEKNQNFIQVINEGRAELLSWAGVVSKAISTEATNAEALRELVNHNSRFLVVTDVDSRVAGIVEREQVIGRMMLALVDSGLQRG